MTHQSIDMTPGELILVGTPIGNLGDLTLRAIETLRQAEVIVCEDTRQARKLLSHLEIPRKTLIAMPVHAEASALNRVLGLLKEGKRIACITDAGMPGISDPAERLVAAAAEAGYAVTSSPGPTAATTALALSGLPSERWVFEGFLPRTGGKRRERIQQIGVEERTTVLYESPNRMVATLTEMQAVVGPTRRVAIARELTKKFEQMWRGPIEGAIEYCSEHPKGEFVIVLDGATPQPLSTESVQEVLKMHFSEGVSLKTAVDQTTAELGLKRSAVYVLALKMRPAKKPPKQP